MFDNDNLPDLPSDSSLDMFNNYEKLDVTEKKLELQKTSKTFIKQLCNVYLATDKIQRPEYVESIQKIEELTLAQLLSQVKYAEHALDSLMRQLDAGGFMDVKTYDTIMQLQTNSIKITMQVAQYVRNLPTYFKSLEEDITKYSSIDLVRQGSSKLADVETGEQYEAEEYVSDNIFRGSGDMLKMIERAKKLKQETKQQITQEIESINDIEHIDSAELVKNDKMFDIDSINVDDIDEDDE